MGRGLEQGRRSPRGRETASSSEVLRRSFHFEPYYRDYIGQTVIGAPIRTEAQRNRALRLGKEILNISHLNEFMGALAAHIKSREDPLAVLEEPELMPGEAHVVRRLIWGRERLRTANGDEIDQHTEAIAHVLPFANLAFAEGGNIERLDKSRWGSREVVAVVVAGTYNYRRIVTELKSGSITFG